MIGVAARRTAVAVVVLATVAACAASQPLLTAGVIGPAPGFLRGLWHGFIAPVAFIVSLVSDTIRVYAFPNSGRWYDFGFMLGISGFSGGVFAGSRSKQGAVG